MRRSWPTRRSSCSAAIHREYPASLDAGGFVDALSQTVKDNSAWTWRPTAANCSPNTTTAAAKRTVAQRVLRKLVQYDEFRTRSSTALCAGAVLQLTCVGTGYVWLQLLAQRLDNKGRTTTRDGLRVHHVGRGIRIVSGLAHTHSNAECSGSRSGCHGLADATGCRCHGLADLRLDPWSITIAATGVQRPLATRCHGLDPWSVTVAATGVQRPLSDRCHGLARGVSRLSLHRRRNVNLHGQAHGILGFRSVLSLSSERRLHGTSPWHLDFLSVLSLSSGVRLHGTSPWHLGISYPFCLLAASVILLGTSPWHLDFLSVLSL